VRIPLLLKLDNGAKYIAYPDVVSCSFPVYFKVYESRCLLFVRSFLRGNGIMIDIGANIGLYSLSLKDEISKFILFEPIEETVGILRANMLLNNLNFEINNFALGNKSGVVTLKYETKCPSLARISEEREGNLCSVRMERLDDCLSEDVLSKVEFVKIDVEGYELEVLKGAHKLFESKSVRLIQFERLQSIPLDPILDFFERSRWNVFALENGLSSFERAVIEKAHDLFAVPAGNAI
jgi:FkbM family methyltransferase